MQNDDEPVKNNNESEPNPEDMFIDRFPGDEDKIIGPNWKPCIYWVPEVLTAGFAWLLGIREPIPLIMIALFCGGIMTALLYYLFFSEEDFFQGFLEMFRRPRR